MTGRRTGVGTTALAVVVMAGALLIAPSAPAARAPSLAVTARPAPRLAPANPRFVVWQALRGLDPVLESISPHGLGEQPGPQPVLKSDATMDVPERLGYAASFDLRTQGKLTPVRNQGSWGTCWSFATFGALESALMPGESLDFSEDNLVLNSGFDTGATASAKYNYGGNLQMSTAYLARWGGPVLESEDAYGDGTTPAGLSARKHVQDISWYSPRTSEADNDRIKYALTTCGGVYVSMSWQGATGSSSDYYNAATHAYYYNGTTGGDQPRGPDRRLERRLRREQVRHHPARQRRVHRPQQLGQRLGREPATSTSPTTTPRLGRTSNAATLEGARSSTDYDAVYQYDPLGYTAAMGYGGATAWEANRFTATADSALNAVAFYALSVDTAYEVYEGPSTASLTKVAQGTVPQMGFHTVTVPAGTDLANGAAFVVAVKLTSPGSSFPIALENPISGYASPTAATGQSYISCDGGSWTDVAASYANTNVCLKAYASRTPTSTSAYGFAADATSGWKTSAQTVTITASGGDGTSRTIHYSQDGGATWSTTAGHTADVLVNTEGAHHIEYYASDSVATETTHDAGWVNIDTVAPVTTDDHPATAVMGPATITLAPSDATSGMAGGAAKTEYKIRRRGRLHDRHDRRARRGHAHDRLPLDGCGGQRGDPGQDLQRHRHGAALAGERLRLHLRRRRRQRLEERRPDGHDHGRRRQGDRAHGPLLPRRRCHVGRLGRRQGGRPRDQPGRSPRRVLRLRLAGERVRSRRRVGEPRQRQAVDERDEGHRPEGPQGDPQVQGE